MRNKTVMQKGKFSNLKWLPAFALLLLCISEAFADVRLPALISDNMVLQQKTIVTLWGWASPGEKIAINGNWVKTTYHGTANEKGEWKIAMPTPASGDIAYSMFIQGDNNSIHIKNVVFGEVWLCSGQSNMQFTIAKGPRPWESGVDNYEAEVAKINNPKIREFTVKQVAADAPVTNAEGDWQEANPQNARLFSAVAYYFAREVNAKTGYPVGLINSTWGGTPAESWTRKEVLESDPELNKILTSYQKSVAEYPQALVKYEADLNKWRTDTAAAKLQHTVLTKAPVKPVLVSGNNAPAKLYNGMIAPLQSYTIKGVIWYHGESNADRPHEYEKLFPALIKGWRTDYNNNDLSFYFVQLAPYIKNIAELREAQLNTYKTLPHTGMAVITDYGDSAQVHPRNKEVVGQRLALWALHFDYGYSDVAYSGPLYKTMKIEFKQVRLEFDELAGGLEAKDGDLREFSIAGPDHVFHTAQARIDGGSVLVSSPLVTKPQAVRFAWRAVPVPNLYNKAGLPASPFRTDNWPTSITK